VKGITTVISRMLLIRILKNVFCPALDGVAATPSSTDMIQLALQHIPPRPKHRGRA
jgi:hypothetical protein